eukprot:TRINITY_DN9154_c0_g1_i1.p1 TRINITY_DN9154_c0_g1~~TRINITY_DN9154_c0_g1_i1.p1  ORF type:complete len:361 (+),score=32.71 TRINITY_DN9154_c0_g1_i1:211-1293(+)
MGLQRLGWWSLLLLAPLGPNAARRHPSADPSTMKDHQYVFVVGQHHSGTTVLALILCEHHNISCLRHSRAPENEGQHLQKAYPSARYIGRMHQYGHHHQAHLIETDPRFEQRDIPSYLYQQWSHFWNVSCTYLVEKSPRHVTMTRFLQRAFTPARSHFVFILRHPLGASHYFWHGGRGKRRKSQSDCGQAHIQHWLKVYGYLVEDAPLLRNVVGLRFEDYLNRSKHLAQMMTDKMFAKLGVGDGIRLEFNERHEDAFNDTHSLEHHNHQMGEEARNNVQHRRLLDFHGDRLHLEISYGGVWQWVDGWNEMTNHMAIPACQAVIRDYEPILNEYGYSLKNLTWLGEPKRLAQHLIQAKDYG